ncbi:uncharacterized protein [Ptychodera flava]|uniref:uncharacterized protein n=1 Tax=Ptychodera flava TaxID=63121 RepID=UPI003969D6F6
MVTEMRPVQSWPGQNGKAMLMPKLQSATLSPGRAHFNGQTDSVHRLSRPTKKSKSSVSFLPEPYPKKVNGYYKNGYSPNPRKARYVHQTAALPSIANGISTTSSRSSPFPIRKSRPNTKGAFPNIGSPRSLPSRLSLYDSLTRESTKLITRLNTRNFTRDNGQVSKPLVARERTRISLKREPTIIAPSTHGFHPRSHSPTYKALIDVKEYLEANLAKEIKEFIKSTEGIRATNNSVFTEAPSTVTFQPAPDERRGTSSMLNEYFESTVQGIDATSTAGDIDSRSLHSEMTDSRESIGQPGHATRAAPPRPTVNFHFDLSYLKEHLNDRSLLTLDTDEVEKRYRSKHKPEKKKAKKSKPTAPPDPLLLTVFPLKKRRRKRPKKINDGVIAEEDESRLSTPEGDEEEDEDNVVVDLTRTYSESLDETEVESEYDYEFEPTPRKLTADPVNVPVTIDNIDEKMAQTSQILQSTFKRISEAEKKGAAEKPPPRAPSLGEEEPPATQELSAGEKYKKMKDRMAKRKQQRAERKESYLQYSLQLEQIKRMNEDFVDDGDEGGNMLASMTFKKIDNIMKYKTKKVGRLGLEVPESDSEGSDNENEHMDESDVIDSDEEEGSI